MKNKNYAVEEPKSAALRHKHLTGASKNTGDAVTPAVLRHAVTGFAELNERALPHLQEVLERVLFLDTRVAGSEVQMINPRRQDFEFGSFSINTETGRWADFATEDAKGGDLTSLVAYVLNLNQGEAAARLQAFLDTLDQGSASVAAAPAKPVAATYVAEIPAVAAPVGEARSPARLGEPVPDYRPAAPGLGVLVAVYEYLDLHGLPVVRSLRYEDGKEKKTFLVARLERDTAGLLRWKLKMPEGARPLYGRHELAKRPEAAVIICEGEKAADAAAKLFPTMVAVTTIAGSKAAAKADFRPLAGREVYVAPDNDEPGERYCHDVIDLATKAGAVVKGVLRYRADTFGKLVDGVPQPVPAKYDLADALDDGLTAEVLQPLFEDLIDPAVVSTASGANAVASHVESLGPKPTVKQLAAAFVKSHFGGKLTHDGSGFRTYRDGHWPLLDLAVDIESPALDFLGDAGTPQKTKNLVETMRMMSAVRAGSFAEPGQLVCLLNGTLDPRTGRLLPHSPDHNLPNRLEIEWDPAAECPTWLRTLNEIFEPDTDRTQKIQFLQEFIGYCMVADTSMHKFLWMVGRGGNGKSLILEVIQMLVGRENVSSAAIERLEDPNVRAELQGKLVNISSEMSSRATVSDGYLKQIVSGDVIDAERKFQAPFSFKPTVRLIGATNELPRLLDHSDGFFRRAIVLTFNRQFSEREQDRDRPGALRKEVGGILRWAVEGLRRLLDRKRFEPPPSSTEALRQYRRDSDPIEQFAADHLTPSMNRADWVSSTELFEAYRNWCSASNYRPVATAKFKTKLEALGWKSGRNSAQRYWEAKYLDGPNLLVAEGGTEPAQSQEASSGPMLRNFIV